MPMCIQSRHYVHRIQSMHTVTSLCTSICCSLFKKLQAVNSSEHYFSMKVNVDVGLTLGLLFFPYDVLERQFMTFDVCISVFCCCCC